MDCPYCGIAFHDSWDERAFRESETPETNEDGIPLKIRWLVTSTKCPSCKNITINIIKQFVAMNNNQFVKENIIRVYPQNNFRIPTPVEIVGNIKNDYEEACNVLHISHKASAALSRRCLQAILREQGYNQKDLALQIEALLKEPDPTKSIPSSLRQTVDVIRNFGNFSAHQMPDKASLEIIPVDEGEAEWCLDILDEMFDHYYVKPKQAADRKAALDAKLTRAGKPPSKS